MYIVRQQPKFCASFCAKDCAIGDNYRPGWHIQRVMTCFAACCDHNKKTLMSMTEIAYQLSYSSPGTFARAFKKQLTLSPQEYRLGNSG
ncbi:helix-turn-helix domain-containing protein [Thalassomonas viridans]|uniref:Helix-turn-helix domain-containing protein n=1 Tax=Thalassomonas viridans TaxID=137584 RepID=A0AAE9Z3M2_9GAMM|nr:helix-turn-helix domain-containing protein [Thalassomonas viridans]